MVGCKKSAPAEAEKPNSVSSTANGPAEQQMQKQVDRDGHTPANVENIQTPDGRAVVDELQKIIEALPEKIVGQKAPDFTLKNLDGNDVSLKDFAGKIVVLEWFNYECPFVRAHYTMDPNYTMKNLTAKYPDVVWLSINSTAHQELEKNRRWASMHKLSWQILEDIDGRVGRAYGAKTTPQMYVIDNTGTVVYQGAIDNAPLGKVEPAGAEKINYVDNALTEVIAGKPVAVPYTKSYGCSVKYK